MKHKVTIVNDEGKVIADRYFDYIVFFGGDDDVDDVEQISHSDPSFDFDVLVTQYMSLCEAGLKDPVDDLLKNNLDEIVSMFGEVQTVLN